MHPRHMCRVVMLCGGLLLAGGCGDKEVTTSPAAPASTPVAASAPPMASLGAEATVDAPPPASSGTTPIATIASPTAGAGGPAGASGVTLEDEDGNPLTDALKVMQRAVDMYQDHRFSSVQNENDEPWPELTDLSQLVKYKVVPALPQAPAGKKFVYDAKERKVSLANR
ncbi:MAG: hypothetical protein AB1705_22475 [Verrucomicrobiota bacterium]